MEGRGNVPCSSLAVYDSIRLTAAGFIWGLCEGPFEARRRGLSGIPRASFVVKAVGIHSLQFGILAGVFSITHCQVKRYRKQDDWVNALVAGGVVGALIGARTRSWKKVFGMAAILSSFSTAADYYKTSDKPFDGNPYKGARNDRPHPT